MYSWRKESKDSDLTAVAALAHDAVYVMEEAFRELLQQRPGMFRHNIRRGEVYNKRQKGKKSLFKLQHRSVITNSLQVFWLAT